jgi:hypothetical protein
MKSKLLTIAFLVLAIAFGTYVYHFPPKITEPVAPMPNENSTCTDYSTSQKSKLTSGLVFDMVQMYRNNQLMNIQDLNARKVINEDAYSIWFDLDTLKKFIYHFEKDINQNKTYAKNKKGIRIYYAAYPEKIEEWKTIPEYKDIAFMADDPFKKSYEKKHTLVMIPTLQSKEGKIYDINLFEPNTFVNGISKKEYTNRNGSMLNIFRPKPLYSLLPASSARVARPNPEEEIAARNHGTLVPPDSKAGSGF